MTKSRHGLGRFHGMLAPLTTTLGLILGVACMMAALAVLLGDSPKLASSTALVSLLFISGAALLLVSRAVIFFLILAAYAGWTTLSGRLSEFLGAAGQSPFE